MAKQQVCQKFIYKIRSTRLKNADWQLTLPLDEARRNDEVVSLADSQVLRWIDELNGVADADSAAREIKAEIRKLHKADNTPQNKRAIRKLYAKLDQIQFKPDYMCLIIDHNKDYIRACNGFTINGHKYHRLLGTAGGIKNSTIVFVTERVYGELHRRIENGRDQSKPLVPAKLEAYRALACSASIPVSIPDGILIVNDCETAFKAPVIYLNDEENTEYGEPIMELRDSEDIVLDESDGYGLMLPSLAEKWSYEVGLDYIASGVNTRFCWEKGMVFTFDFVDFANKISHSYIVKDAWGNAVDIRTVELILTTSMVKLWDSYDSLESYISNCLNNKYTFGITKTSPRSLEHERNLNYQFLQSYELTDDDIEELIAPTMNEIKGVLSDDINKTNIFLNGCGLNDNAVLHMPNDAQKALLIEPDIMNDSYVQKKIYQLIRNRINEAKIGVLSVHGNYSIVGGDPFALCQHIFGMEVTGLLKAGEVYNKYWADSDADELVCFRAPMTTHENIRKVVPHRSDRAEYWYQYITTCTLLNAWDTITMALNGCDKDGDLVMLTDNHVLVRKHVDMPAIMCVQRKAKKIVPDEDSIIKSNIASFGDEIGKITNRVTSMFDVQSNYSPDSEEYRALQFRIRCGQLYQQNAIDRAKGIIAKPMPKLWYDRHAVAKSEMDEESKELYIRIASTKKPYFMRYIYPTLMSEYNTYIKNTMKSCLRKFGKTVEELKTVCHSELTEDQSEFLKYYDLMMPVGVSDCVMNRICRRFEREFDHFLSTKRLDSSFDWSILKKNVEYTATQRRAIEKLYTDYNNRFREYTIRAMYDSIDEYDSYCQIVDMRREFVQRCDSECPNRDMLCDILIDICYRKSQSKRFAWEMCGDEIIENLLDKNGRVIRYPSIDQNGDIEYRGNRFSIKTLEVPNEHCS